MFADNGKVGKQQLVSKAWIQEATKPDADRTFLHPSEDSPRQGNMGYQHFWWLWPGDEHAFSAIGFGGQEIYVNPARNIVIVQTATWGAEEAKTQRAETHQLFRSLLNELD